MLQEASRAFTAQFGRDFDVFVSPTMAIEPPLVGCHLGRRRGRSEGPGHQLHSHGRLHRRCSTCGPARRSRCPCHVADSGLPVGVQFAAPPWQEALLLRLASQIEAARPWAALPEL